MAMGWAGIREDRGAPADERAPRLAVNRRTSATAAAGVAALLVAAVADVLQGQGRLPAHVVVDAILAPQPIVDHDLVRDLRLPRAAAGIVAGGALAAATVLLQALTRNRLAEPATLGLTAGGMLAVTAASASTVAVTGLSAVGVAFGGVVAAALVVAALAAAVRAAPVRLVLAGMAVSLALAAMTAAIQLLRETETSGLFLWGAGSLLQTGWDSVRTGALVAGPVVAAALLLARPLDVAVLGEATARALGQRARSLHLAAGVIAALLTAAAVTVAGPISFAGLLAVFVARAARPRGHAGLLLVAVPWGAAIVLGADVVARLLLGTASESPAGVICALAGAPVLIMLARRLRPDAAPGSDRATVGARWRPAPAVTAVAVAPVVALASLTMGDLWVGPVEIAQALVRDGAPLAELVLDIRAPRLCVALLAGACFAAAGTLLQAVVRNPLASPELMGVTGGASVAAVLLLLALPAAPSSTLPFAAFGGGVAALGLVLGLAGPRRGSPAATAVVGLAVTAACAALTTLLIVRSERGAAVAVTWLVGSTYASGWSDVLLLLVPAAALISAALVCIRHLDVIALGPATATILGVRVPATRVALLALAAALAAAAIAVTGAIAFVGLLAPHAARLVAGGNHRRLLPVAMALGMALLATADALGRTLLAPTEIPSGLVVSLIGAPYLAWLMWRTRHAA